MKKSIILFGIVLIIIGILISVCTTFNDTTYTVTVTDKERINDAKSSYYLIFCEDDDGNYYEFKNSDQLFRGKVDSSSYYNKIKIGHRYEFTVVGIRIPLFSKYQNIINMREIEGDSE